MSNNKLLENLDNLDTYILNESVYTVDDLNKDAYEYISNYRVQKTGIRFTYKGTIILHDSNAAEDVDPEFRGERIDINIEIKKDGTINHALKTYGFELDSSTEIDSSIIQHALDLAVSGGYIEKVGDTYVDKRETEETKKRDDFTNMAKMSNEEIAETVPGQTVKNWNNGVNWEVYGVFTAYNGKVYVAMKKKGMFADPNLVEIDKFKKTYSLLK